MSSLEVESHLNSYFPQEEFQVLAYFNNITLNKVNRFRFQINRFLLNLFIIYYSKLSQAMECVYNNTRGCTASQLVPIKDSMNHIQSLVGNSCANVKREMCDTNIISNLTMLMMNDGTMCDETGATECLDLFTNAQSLLTNQGADAVCR